MHKGSLPILIGDDARRRALVDASLLAPLDHAFESRELLALVKTLLVCQTDIERRLVGLRLFRRRTLPAAARRLRLTEARAREILRSVALRRRHAERDAEDRANLKRIFNKPAPDARGKVLRDAEAPAQKSGSLGREGFAAPPPATKQSRKAGDGSPASIPPTERSTHVDP